MIHQRHRHKEILAEPEGLEVVEEVVVMHIVPAAEAALVALVSTVKTIPVEMVEQVFHPQFQDHQ